MSDLSKLLDRFATGGLTCPSPERASLVDLARALAVAAGADGLPLSLGAADLVERIGPSEHLVFILADGLGMNLLEELPAGAFMRRHLVRELTSVFPSTTATALTTLATGAWPSQHGVTGQWTHLSQVGGTAALLPFAARVGGKPLGDLGVDLTDAFPLPALMSRVGRDTLAVFPARLVNGASSIYFSGNRARRGYETLSEAVEIIQERVAFATAPTYTYLYSPRIDAEAHYLGVRHPGVRAVVGEMNGVVERLAAGMGKSTRLVLCADHGLLDAPVSARHSLKPTADLFNLLRCTPSGDDRVQYFHLCDGAEERLRERLKARFGDSFLLLRIGEAEEQGLFGPDPISPRVRDRFGDLLLVSAGADVVEYVPSRQVGRRVDLNAYHSGLSPDEMRVPLVIV